MPKIPRAHLAPSRRAEQMTVGELGSVLEHLVPREIAPTFRRRPVRTVAQSGKTPNGAIVVESVEFVLRRQVPVALATEGLPRHDRRRVGPRTRLRNDRLRVHPTHADSLGVDPPALNNVRI
jgi:hypothetical protein